MMSWPRRWLRLSLDIWGYSGRKLSRTDQAQSEACLLRGGARGGICVPAGLHEPVVLRQAREGPAEQQHRVRRHLRPLTVGRHRHHDLQTRHVSAQRNSSIRLFQSIHSIQKGVHDANGWERERSGSPRETYCLAILCSPAPPQARDQSSRRRISRFACMQPTNVRLG